MTRSVSPGGPSRARWRPATHAVVRVGYAERTLLAEATGDVDACVAYPKADWLATALPLVQLFFWDARRRFASFPHAQAAG